MRRISVVLALALLTIAATALREKLLPSGWHLSAPAGSVAATGTMPQGLALSPDDTKLAVLDSGFNPPAVRILHVPDLRTIRVLSMKDAIGIPLWMNDRIVLIAGGSANAIFAGDVDTGKTVSVMPMGGYPDALALFRLTSVVDAVGDANTAFEDFSTPSPAVLEHGYDRTPWPACASGDACLMSADSHPAAVAVTTPPQRVEVYIADRAHARIITSLGKDDTRRNKEIAVDLHPDALALSNDGRLLYVACADADAVDVIDVKSDRVVARIDVGLPQGPGASPNALAVARDGTLYVSLGAENAVAEIRSGRVIARVPTGWYPTGVAVDAHNVYVSDGKGEGSRANPQFDWRHGSRGAGYVASTLDGSVRAIPRTSFTAKSTAQVLSNIPSPEPRPPQTVVRAGGPIEHVIYIIKENRTYDQVLGDLPGADGDPKLAVFGAQVTPNQHAIATRFGIFDATFTDAQVSASGHNWSTAAFANDYVERFWPPVYGDRRDLYDFEDGAVAATPRNGYLWDDADRNHVSVRDYGEFASDSTVGAGMATTSMPGLKGNIDEHYPPFNLDISDDVRIDEWKKEFDGYVAHDDLPSLEIIRLPNDHTKGTAHDALTPQAYLAQNDHALGRLVDIVSHSKYWASTAIFAIEDDAQAGPDHVDDQRTTLYLASPYAAHGVHHAHYTTSGVLRTMELLLGLPPMSIYDAVAPPLYDAFALKPDLTPFDVIAPHIDLNATNRRTAYGAAESARMDFTHADAADEAKLNDILMHAAGKP